MNYETKLRVSIHPYRCSRVCATQKRPSQPRFARSSTYRKCTGIRHPTPKKASGTGWWDASQARFHLCLPKNHTRTAPSTMRCKCRDDVWQGRFAPSGSPPERGAGKHFACLEVDSGKIALSRLAHQPLAETATMWRARRVRHEDHTGRAASRWVFPCKAKS